MGLYTQNLYVNEVFFAVQVIKDGGRFFCVFLIGEEISEDSKLQLTELNNLKKLKKN